MAELDLDSLTEGLSGILKSTLDNIAPYNVRIINKLSGLITL